MSDKRYAALVLFIAMGCGSVDGPVADRTDELEALDDVVPLSATASTCTPLAVVQAVNMTTKTTGADYGGYWNLWANGYLEQTISFANDGAHEVVISAQATLARGIGPNMELRLDGRAVGATEVRGATWSDYRFVVNVSAGAHRVAIAFTNDLAISRTEDRNLFLRTLTVRPVTCSTTPSCDDVATLQAVQMSTKTTGADYGGYWNLWANGYLEQGVTFPTSGSYELTVEAWASLVDNVGANMEVRIDQQRVGGVEVRAASFSAYTITANVTAGNHRVAIAFTNDLARSVAVDRNLYLKTLAISPFDCGGEEPQPSGDQIESAVRQNTPGASTVFPEGVPDYYDWYRGKNGQIGKALAPAGFTAMTGWGIIYPQKSAPASTNPNARIELAAFKAYVHRVGGGWTLVQQQTANNVAGGFFVSDFSGNQAIPWVQTNLANNVVQLGVPPTNYNAHFWMNPRGTYGAGSVDGVFVRVNARTTDTATNVVIALGGDWWRDATAPYVFENGVFVNNPGIGTSNWTKLSTSWQPIYYHSLTNDQLRADPPPFD